MPIRSQSNDAYWRGQIPSDDATMSPFTRKNKYTNAATVGNNSLSADKDNINNVSNFFVGNGVQKRQNHGSKQKVHPAPGLKVQPMLGASRGYTHIKMGAEMRQPGTTNS